METLRRDAARNRERILAAARGLRKDGEVLQLNAVARRAEVGVGTVYRHFATPDALAEGLVEHRFGELIDVARAAAVDPDALDGLRRFLREALGVYAEDEAFADASVAASPVREETRAARRELVAAFGELVTRASEHVRPGLDAADLMVLVCGMAYSVRLRPSRSAVYVDALLDALLR